MTSSTSAEKQQLYRERTTSSTFDLWRPKKQVAWMVTASIAVFWGFVSLIPIYNKFFFHKTLYPYPIASAGIQLGIVSILLAIFSLVRHWVRSRRRDERIQHSWLLGPGMAYKIQWTAPIGVLFGLKYGVTNLGLALLPAPTHLLLQSTDLIWTCLAAWFIKDERLSWVGYACMAGCVVGSVITSWTAVQNYNQTQQGNAFDGASWWAILVNLLSPILLGLCIATLRVACKRLLIPDNPNLQGATMDSSELTCWKLIMSSSVALMLACFMEGGETKEDWYTAFKNLESSTRWGVSMGSLLILVFQVNCTFLTNLTSAYAVGLVGQLKIIPQWVTAALIAPEKSFHLHTGNLVGALLTMIAAAVFAIHNYTTSAAQVEETPPPEGNRVEKLWLLGAASGMDNSESMLYGSTLGPDETESESSNSIHAAQPPPPNNVV